MWRNPLIRSFIISLLYVGFSTFCLLSLYPKSPTYFEWSMLGVLITIPVSFISFGILYMEADNQYILWIQGAMFFIFWWFVYRIYVKKSQKKC